MITEREKMFSSDNEQDSKFTANTATREVVKDLDQLAMKLLEGDVELVGSEKREKPPSMNAFGGYEVKRPQQLTVIYHED